MSGIDKNRLEKYYESNDRSFWTNPEGVESSSVIREIYLPTYPDLVKLMRSGAVSSTAYNLDLFFKHVDANLRAQAYSKRFPDRSGDVVYEKKYQRDFGNNGEVHHFFHKKTHPEVAIDAENLFPTRDVSPEPTSRQAHTLFHRGTDKVLWKELLDVLKELVPATRALIIKHLVSHIPSAEVRLHDVKTTLDTFWSEHQRRHHTKADDACSLCDSRKQSFKEQAERERAEQADRVAERQKIDAERGEIRIKHERAMQEAALADQAREQKRAETVAELDRIELDRRQRQAELAEMDRQAADKRIELAELEAQRAHKEAEQRELEQKRADKDTRERAEIEQKRADKEAELAKLEQEKTEKETRLAEIEQKRAGKEAELAKLEQETTDREAKLVELQREKAEREAERAELQREADLWEGLDKVRREGEVLAEQRAEMLREERVRLDEQNRETIEAELAEIEQKRAEKNIRDLAELAEREIAEQKLAEQKLVEQKLAEQQAAENTTAEKIANEVSEPAEMAPTEGASPALEKIGLVEIGPGVEGRLFHSGLYRD
jgi:hypothetical protein